MSQNFTSAHETTPIARTKAMARKPLLAIPLMAFVAVLIVASWHLAPQADAEDARVIPVRLIDVDRGTDDAKAGDTCTFTLDFARYFMTPHQMVITDEHGTIIAVEAAEGILEESAVVPGELDCVAELDISVPAAKVYTVYLGDERIIAYTPEDFPIEDPFDQVSIRFE